MLFDQLGNQHGRSGVLHALGNIAYHQEEYEKAEGFYRESLALSEQLGHQRECALTLGQLGSLAEKKEDYHEALACMAQALMIFRSLQVPERQTMLDQITKLRVAMGEDTFTALARGNRRTGPVGSADIGRSSTASSVLDDLFASTNSC